MTTVTSKQIGAIHTLKARAALDDDSYRDILHRETGQRSAKALSRDQAFRVIERLKVLSGGSERPSRAAAPPLADGALKLEGPFVGQCRSLWIAAWNLGVIEDRRDTALVAFVERQTGIASLSWLRDPLEAAKAIEGLKAWINRVAPVTWDAEVKALRRRGMTIGRWRKIAVVRAQCRLLAEEAPASLDAHSDAELQQLQTTLGRRIRRMQDRRARA
ncbi:regulatory protein GemA [Ancylobacter pratisalsi]|uniref:Regulatory protein GemA n=1 Tax=Ancylobacter pratisalsi TaxID=1745854 RepID=A0A6P1YN14_9HYPH|nr:regulatory protein GemA [Ancylobacter pratisalsi]QIB34768.1 regulatory protein GemA [Ancylobacter pratisalsi]